MKKAKLKLPKTIFIAIGDPHEDIENQYFDARGKAEDHVDIGIPKRTVGVYKLEKIVKVTQTVKIEVE